MKIFLDTSSLFKLYYKEADTPVIENIFRTNKIDEIFISELTVIEFASTVWKKIRTREITDVQAKSITKAFEKDAGKYSMVHISNAIIEEAKMLMANYGLQGLRTLDSIQFAVARALITTADLFITSDTLLQSFFIQEGLPV